MTPRGRPNRGDAVIDVGLLVGRLQWDTDLPNHVRNFDFNFVCGVWFSKMIREEQVSKVDLPTQKSVDMVTKEQNIQQANSSCLRFRRDLKEWRNNGPELSSKGHNKITQFLKLVKSAIGNGFKRLRPQARIIPNNTCRTC